MTYLTLECDGCNNRELCGVGKAALGYDYTEENIRAYGPAIVAAHPEGGCWKLAPMPSGDYKPVYDPKEGQECWGPRAEAVAQKGLTEAQRAAIIEAVKAQRPELFAPQEPAGYGPGLWAMYDVMRDYREQASAPVRSFIEYQDEIALEGWLPDITKPFRQAAQWVAKRTLPTAVRKPLQKAIRYAGASGLAATAPVTWAMPASMRKQVFGLSDQESARMETIAKVGRGVVGAVALNTVVAPAVVGSSGLTFLGRVGTAIGAKLGTLATTKAATTAGAEAAAKGGLATMIKQGLGMLLVTKGVGDMLNISRYGANQLPPEARNLPEGTVLPFPQDFAGAPAGFALPAPVAGGPSAVVPMPLTDGEAPPAEALPAEAPAAAGLGAAVVVIPLGALLIFLAMRRKHA